MRFAPTAQTSSPELPHTAERDPLESEAATVMDQVSPSQCRMTPSPPTDQASFELLLHTPRRATCVGTTAGDQSVPFQWKRPTTGPTAHASFGPLPDTRVKKLEPPGSGPRNVDQLAPFQ